ncbi:MAG TPA: hypothetical protein DDY52_02695 [Candidatus Moranbacteria bacterium]|nr:hypothetical protein [Candidatus Moranbacteria bacterium]
MSINVITKNPVDNAIALIRECIETNQNLSGVNFSSFFAYVIKVASDVMYDILSEMERQGCTEEKSSLPITESEEVRNLFFVIKRRIIETSNFLEQELGRGKVSFDNINKAITFIGLMSYCDCDPGLRKIDNLIQKLSVANENEAMNQMAKKYF